MTRIPGLGSAERAEESSARGFDFSPIACAILQSLSRPEDEDAMPDILTPARLNLTDGKLLRSFAYIGGKWCAPASCRKPPNS